jgi:uncharacterized RDD family membrane protein YckC
MIELKINTTQNVNINFTAASLGDRILAYLFDFVIILLYLFGAFNIGIQSGIVGSTDDKWSNIAISMLILLPAMLYTLVSEVFMEGQTLGKKVLKIKVVKIDGYQASIFDYMIRWVFRLIDIYLGFGTGGIAILSIAISDKSQRIGDMAAGTAVISLKDKCNIKHTILEEVSDLYQPHYPSVINLSDKDMQIIKDRYTEAIVKKDFNTLIKLRMKVEEITKTSRGTKSDLEYLDIIMKDYTHYTQKM